MKYLIRPKDRINTPVPEMGKIRREMIVDSDSVGAEVLTFGYARYEPKATGKAFEKNTPTLMLKKLHSSHPAKALQ